LADEVGDRERPPAQWPASTASADLLLDQIVAAILRSARALMMTYIGARSTTSPTTLVAQ
jgi:hypothetical protein